MRLRRAWPVLLLVAACGEVKGDVHGGGTTAGGGGTTASPGGAPAGSGGAGGEVFLPSDEGGTPIDGGVACADRADACAPGTAAKDLLSALVTGCASTWVCGSAVVDFGGDGCAIDAQVWFSDLSNAVAQCVLDGLAARRWSCAAGQSVQWYESCTVAK
jgi:hypothetical protein